MFSGELKTRDKKTLALQTRIDNLGSSFNRGQFTLKEQLDALSLLDLRQFPISSQNCNYTSVEVRKNVKEFLVLFQKNPNCQTVLVQRTVSIQKFFFERTVTVEQLQFKELFI